VKITSTTMILLFISVSCIYSQVWQQTAGAPEGGGVTDMVVRQLNQHIFVTTSSYNWPNGDMGGVRRSVDEGSTWENLWDVYIARTIIDGGDGNLYASIWPYPQEEGLYRSTDDGSTWGSPLVTVPTGDNIFSVVLNPTTPDQTIFAGTRNGVLRSLDNGVTFNTANNGIPSNSWVYDMKMTIDSNLIVATSNGVFYSEINGDNWLQVTGVSSEDTVAHIGLGSEIIAKNNNAGYSLELGTTNGKLYDGDTGAWAVELVDLFIQNGIIKTSDDVNSILDLVTSESLQGFNKTAVEGQPRLFGVYSQPGLQGGGVVYAIGDTGRFVNEGFPSYAPVSVVEMKTQTNSQTLFAGFFLNQNGGAKVYKRDFVVTVERENDQAPTNYALDQNYPNPFNPTTTISFFIPKTSRVTLEIYNSLGEKVSTLVSKTLPASTYQYEWDSEGLASGIYFYRLQAGDFVQTKEMLLLK